MAEQLSRRKFLKLLGLGGGSLAMIGSGLAANLLSGTTIGGYTVWHSGNDGFGSGLDADSVDGHNVYVQSSQPSNPSDGDIWIEL